MTRLLALLSCLLLPAALFAQSRTVDPSDLELWVTVEESDVVPYQSEMVLITIHGIYRRHITREKLEQPDLAGFNWMQLGNDQWFDSRERGIKVKRFRRRMALFPDRAGTLEIGAFTHHLTLTDEGDDWFDHDIRSEPLTIEVAPRPEADGWWFPVRRLEVSDQWSNAPDQLEEGAGVLRVIRLTAIGVSPEMLPPMPELTSPSALIFPHPEKRLVELSPAGPVAVGFWRWTISPTNGTSAIVEPIEFDYFDTTTREAHTVTISAQRIAHDAAILSQAAPPEAPVMLRSGLAGGVAIVSFAAAMGLFMWGRRLIDPRTVPAFDPLRRRVRAAARRGDHKALRRAAAALLRRDGGTARAALLAELDGALFRPGTPPPDPRTFARAFLSARA